MTSNEESKQLQKDLLGRLQECLRRCALCKMTRTRFALRCSRSCFKALLGGHVDSCVHHTGDEMKAEIFGECGEEVAAKMKSTLGVSDTWFTRRWHGEKVDEERDCSCVDVDPTVSQKKSVMFTWVQKKMQHMDHEGVLRSSSFAKVVVSFPRACEPVEPM